MCADEHDQDSRDQVKEEEGAAEERLHPLLLYIRFGELISCLVLHSWVGRHQVYAPRVSIAN